MLTKCLQSVYTELFVSPSLADCLTGLTGSSTQAGTGRTALQLIGSSVDNCQALTLPNVDLYVFVNNTEFVARQSLKRDRVCNKTEFVTRPSL